MTSVQTAPERDEARRGSPKPLLLMTPGPSRVPERVLRAGARPMLHHRTPEFSQELGAMLNGLRPIFGTKGDVLPVHSTGRGAMEAAICNLFSPGDRIVACCNGKFGEMWAGFAESHGLDVLRVARDWSVSIDLAEVEAALREHAGTRAVTFVQSDTSTGVLNDVPNLCCVAREAGALAMVDCISGLGGMPFEFDAWGCDIAVTASQKCLMASAGLAFVAISERAWVAARTAKLPHNYWDFQAIRESLAKPQPQTPGTTPVHLVLQVSEALRMMHEEGLNRIYERHEAMARSARAGTAALGLAPQCPDLDRSSPTLTAIAAPEGVDPGMIRTGLKKRGILVAGGLGRYKGTSFRIGHIGDIRPADVELTLAALADVLMEVGDSSGRVA